MVIIVLSCLIVALVVIIIIGQVINTKDRIALTSDFENRIDVYEDMVFLRDESFLEFKSHQEDINKRWMERIFAQDAKHKADERVLLFMLFQAKGITLPHNESGRLQKDFFDEALMKTDKINEQEKAIRDKFMAGEGK